MAKLKNYLVRSGLVEALTWLLALIYLAYAVPSDAPHFVLCPLNAIGVENCMGCGLGRSITYLFHGQFADSFNMHLLGIPAAILLSWRIIYLFRRMINKYLTA